MTDKNLNMLLDLLCVLHRDGGHYTAKFGLEKSIKDGKLKYLKLVHEKDNDEQRVYTDK